MDERKEFGEKMPEMAAFIEGLCREFGDAVIWTQVEKGFAGEQTFFARENGVQVGTRDTRSVVCVRWDEKGISYTTPADWILDARELARRRGFDIKPGNPDVWGDEDREAKELRNMIATLKGKRK
jgi:hypothetical protein